MNASSITKITSWLKFLGNLYLVGCATVCGKSEVMPIVRVFYRFVIIGSTIIWSVNYSSLSHSQLTKPNFFWIRLWLTLTPIRRLWFEKPFTTNTWWVLSYGISTMVGQLVPRLIIDRYLHHKLTWISTQWKSLYSMNGSLFFGRIYGVPISLRF